MVFFKVFYYGGIDNCSGAWYKGVTVAINESLCMKNVGAQIAMDFS